MRPGSPGPFRLFQLEAWETFWLSSNLGDLLTVDIVVCAVCFVAVYTADEHQRQERRKRN